MEIGNSSGERDKQIPQASLCVKWNATWGEWETI